MKDNSAGNKFLIEYGSRDSGKVESVDLEWDYRKHVKPRYMIGFIVGVLPVQNIFSSKSVHGLVFTRLSPAFAVSWLCLVLKFLGFLHVTTLLRQVSNQVKYERSLTDLIALSMTIATTYCFGVVMHFLSILNVGELLEVMKSVVDFMKKYPTIRRRNLKRSLWGVPLTFYVALYPVYIIWYTTSIGLEGVGQLTFTLPGTAFSTRDHRWVILIVYTAAVLLYLETAVLHFFGMLSFSSQIIVMLMGSIIHEIDEKIKLANTNTKDFNISVMSPGGESQWTAISQSYIELLSIFQRYENYVASKCIAIYLLLVSGIIGGAYYVLRSENPLTKELEISQFLMYLSLLYRVHFLANTGERISKQYGRLVSSLSKISNNTNTMNNAEKYEVTRLRTIVVNTPIQLSAKGFFSIRRSNIPKVVSVILTYIIVLLQFRMTDKIILE